MRIINTKHFIYIRKYICEVILTNNLQKNRSIYIYIHIYVDLNKEFVSFILYERIWSNFKVYFVYFLRSSIRQKCKIFHKNIFKKC